MTRSRSQRDAVAARRPRSAVTKRRKAVRRARVDEKLDQIRGRYGPRWWLPWASGALTLAGLALLGATTHSAIEARCKDALRGERFQVSAVTVMGNEHITAQEVLHSLALPDRTALVDLDPDLLEARLVAHPHVASATILRWPPAKLLVQVEERTPSAVVFLPGQRQPYLVDAEGRPYAPAGTLHVTNFPILVSATPSEIGEADATLALAVELAHNALRYGLGETARVHLGAEGDTEGISLALGGGAQRVILGTGDFIAKLSRLRALHEADLPEVAAAAEIDLRFRDQVVLRSQLSSKERGTSGGHAWMRAPVQHRAQDGSRSSQGGVEHVTQG